jgi:putative aminopeptidase FrvX
MNANFRGMGSRVSRLILAFVVAAGAAAAQTPSDWDLLRTIVLIPGISSQEVKVMDWIQSQLPKGVKAERDSKNDVWFTVGEGKPHILFVAHADELGMTVETITSQGTVRLKGRAGFLPQACEARPFVIHAAKGPVEGIMLPRPDYDAKAAKPYSLDPYELYVGASTEEEAKALGVAVGDQVIFKKKIADLGPDIMATRAVDDRAGCASLLAAARAMDWSKVKGKTVTCAWSVEEEIGLYGATALARVIKPDYVFAIDTFVSTDSPIENKRFGYARLGHGAVLRALDSSNLVPKVELRKMIDLAAQKGIPVQVANSRGGNDGSVFVAGGAVDIPLSWPGAHAHSFIEKIQRQDLEALTALITAIITDFR